MSLVKSISLILAAASAAQSEYVWPSKYDIFEDMLAMHSGYRRFGFSDLVVPCNFGANTPGRQTAAEWVRTAFHDMATHDHQKGTGGLDGSLMYEVERAENMGSAFNSTFSDMWEFISDRISVSDMIALGLVAAVSSCEGPKVPLRLGRVDAAEAGPTGVPEPQDTLETFNTDFTRMGFNTEEMIAMVACGHTLGGVHSVDFPEIIGGDDISDTNVPKFDGTSDNFDTAVVDEYLNSKGTNPLVFGHNETTNSDKRIFAADNNVTMHKLSDPDTFSITCADIFARMIDTVPSSVTLSDPIDLINVKPYIDTFQLSEDGTKFNLEMHVRVRTTSGHGYESAPASVAIDFLDRKGNRSSLVANHARLKGGQSYGFYNEVFDWYVLETSLNAAAGVESFKIHIGDEILDNGGNSYPVNDGVVARTNSCLDTSGTQGNVTFTLVSAVRNDLIEKMDGQPWVRFDHRVPQQGVVTPRIAVETTPMSKTSSKCGYTYYSGEVSTFSVGWSTEFGLGVTLNDGTKVVKEYIKTPSDACS